MRGTRFCNSRKFQPSSCWRFGRTVRLAQRKTKLLCPVIYIFSNRLVVIGTLTHNSLYLFPHCHDLGPRPHCLRQFTKTIHITQTHPHNHYTY